jgi:DnaA family protein
MVEASRLTGGQLPLGVGLRDLATLEAFEPGANGAALAWLETALSRIGDPTVGGERGWFLGPGSSGRSHLLQAACHARRAAGGRAIYLTPDVIREHPEAVLDGLERCDLVALDDLDLLAGNRDAELALFGLWNRLQGQGGLLLMAASAPPQGCDWTLPDLASRLAQAVVFRLRPLDDEGRLQALLRRSRIRGIDLDERTARFILARFPRDPAALFALLDDLDEASLSARRRVTIPFVKALIEARSQP